MQHEGTFKRDAERDSLIARIEAAFGHVRLGEGVSLHQARAMDDYESEATIASVRTFDTEHRWQDVSDEKLDRLSDTLPFMDAEGFRFYMPRFMTFALRNEGSGSWARDTAIYWSDTRERAGDHLALLSDEQRDVIRAFCEFYAHEA
jgi:hypothetical protein